MLLLCCCLRLVDPFVVPGSGRGRQEALVVLVVLVVQVLVRQ
jgi:hypothetical protein